MFFFDSIKFYLMKVDVLILTYFSPLGSEDGTGVNSSIVMEKELPQALATNNSTGTHSANNVHSSRPASRSSALPSDIQGTYFLNFMKL